ncbi:MAG TPA: hypothetical protein V7792_00490 [Candidatus Azoamicus sp. OHIO2]
MFIFYIFLRFSNFIIKFLYSLFYKKNNPLEQKSQALKMLQCDKCKIYITKTDATIINGKTFCKDHKD